MANKKISELVELTTPSSSDLLPIVSGAETKKITVGNLIGDKYVRTTRFAIISSGTSGTITLPANSQVVLDDFGGTVDAVVSTVTGGFPTTIPAKTGTTVVATTFTSLGAWSLSSTPSAYPVAIIYRVRQKLLDFDSTASNIWGPSNNEIVTKADIGLGSVDNTTDLAKPISTATATALNGKEATANKAIDLTSPNNTKYPTTLAVSTALGFKQNVIGYTPENDANKVTDIALGVTHTQYPSALAVYNLATFRAPFYHIKDIRFNTCGPGLSGETVVLFYERQPFLEKNGSLVIHSIVCRREPGNDKIFFRLRISNNDVYATSTVIATCQIDASNKISNMQRTFTNNGSNLYGVEFNYSLNTDMIQHPLYDQVGFTWDQPYYFWVTVEIPDSSDSCEIGGIKIGV
jgi:hypothetical protein